MAPAPARVFIVYVKSTCADVWKAITESDFTQRYYYASTVESDWEPGEPYRYLVGGNEAIVGEIVESDPPSRLVLTFDARWDEEVAADPPSRLTWEIADAGPGIVEVKAIHDGLVPGSATERQIEGMAFVLSGLKTLLETGEPLMPASASAAVS